MNWETIITALIVAVLFPLLKISVDALKEFLEAQIQKVEDEQFASIIRSAVGTVSDVVVYVMQTYVDSLKAKGEFDAMAQEEALNMARKRATELINSAAKKAIEVEYGDFSTWLDSQIENDVWHYKR